MLGVKWEEEVEEEGGHVSIHRGTFRDTGSPAHSAEERKQPAGSLNPCSISLSDIIRALLLLYIPFPWWADCNLDVLGAERPEMVNGHNKGTVLPFGLLFLPRWLPPAGTKDAWCSAALTFLSSSSSWGHIWGGSSSQEAADDNSSAGLKDAQTWSPSSYFSTSAVVLTPSTSFCFGFKQTRRIVFFGKAEQTLSGCGHQPLPGLLTEASVQAETLKPLALFLCYGAKEMVFPISHYVIKTRVCSHCQVFLIKFLWEERRKKIKGNGFASRRTLKCSCWASTKRPFSKWSWQIWINPFKSISSGLLGWYHIYWSRFTNEGCTLINFANWVKCDDKCRVQQPD